MPESRRLRPDSRPRRDPPGSVQSILSRRAAAAAQEKAQMSRNLATEPLPAADAVPRFDWREWLAFTGCVLGTALFVSVVLAALVLVISTNTIS